MLKNRIINCDFEIGIMFYASKQLSVVGGRSSVVRLLSGRILIKMIKTLRFLSKPHVIIDL